VPLVLLGCGGLALSSRWCDRLVLIDGKNAEWQEALTYLDDQEASVGILNDDKYLYVALMSNNRQLQMQVLRMGMTLWFDAEGGKKKSLGIHFPVGVSEQGDMREMMQPGGMQTDPADFQKIFAESIKELEIIRPESSGTRRMALGQANNEDIYVQLSAARGGFVYELRIPLSADSSSPIAIGTQAGRLIGIGLETPEIDMSKMRERSGGGRPSGGAPPGGMGGGGGRMPGGGMPGGGRGFERPEPLKVWAKVQLARAEPTIAEEDNAGVKSE